MRILIIAPQPYYSERGTPISVELLIRALRERGDEVEVLTYHEGEDRPPSGVPIHRIRPWFPIRDIPPGPSVKKLASDVFLFWKAASLIRSGKFDMVHALEESVFVAAVMCRRRGIPFVYDMDSSMATQIEDRYPTSKILHGMLHRLEAWALRRSHAVVPMCDALAEEYAEFKPGRFFVLHDISLRIDETPEIRETVAALDLGAPQGSVKLMYIGNLEYYQGIGLLLDGLALAIQRGQQNVHLVVIGGRPEDIDQYQARSGELGIAEFVTFVGPRPVSELGPLMERADVMVSPRIEGVNTPMKVYSYLDSGRALLATDLPTHTQVMDETMACLVGADAESMADGIARVAESADYRERIAAAAKQRAQEKHTYNAFRDTVHRMYSLFEKELQNKESHATRKT